MTAGFSIIESRVLSILPKITGFTSFLFSLLIVIIVLYDDKKRNRTYHRLLCGISIVDMSSSFWLGLSTWPIPKTSTTTWALGNESTCNVQGFFTQFGIASSFYNASISIYFLLTIRYGWKERKIRKIEPILHAVPLLWGLGTSTASVSLGILGNANLWCWISRQDDIFRWTFFYGPLWTMIVIVTISLLLIFNYVNHLERTTRKYKYGKRNNNHFNQPQQFSSSGRFSDLDHRCEPIDDIEAAPVMVAAETTIKDDENSVSLDKVLQILPQEIPTIRAIQDEPSTSLRGLIEEDENENSDNNVHESVSGENGMKPNAVPFGEVPKDDECDLIGNRLVELDKNNHNSSRQQQSIINDCNNNKNETIIKSNNSSFNKSLNENSNNNNKMKTASRLSFIQRIRSSRTRKHEEAEFRRRTKEVAWQCFWYAAAFYLNWVALSITRLLQSINGQVYYPLLVIAAITTPMQGLPNFIVYLGPKFRKLRKENGFWHAFVGSLARERRGQPSLLPSLEEPPTSHCGREM